MAPSRSCAPPPSWLPIPPKPITSWASPCSEKVRRAKRTRNSKKPLAWILISSRLLPRPCHFACQLYTTYDVSQSPGRGERNFIAAQFSYSGVENLREFIVAGSSEVALDK